MRADALLAFERRGHCTMRGALPPEAVRAVVPEIDALFRKRERDALEQKVRVLLGDGELARARSKGAGGTRALKRLLEGLPDGSVPFLQLFHLSRAIPALDALLRSPALAGTAAALLGCDARSDARVRLYQDSLFVKRAGDGQTHWHADLAMCPLDTNAFVTCWIPLQPVPVEEDGGSGLVYAQGSHRDVALPFWHGDPREADDLSGREYAEAGTGALALGDVAWHHGWTLHCAPPNQRRTPRRVSTIQHAQIVRARHDPSRAWLTRRPGCPGARRLLLSRRREAAALERAHAARRRGRRELRGVAARRPARGARAPRHAAARRVAAGIEAARASSYALAAAWRARARLGARSPSASYQPHYAP